jgi:hypothetical protein
MVCSLCHATKPDVKYPLMICGQCAAAGGKATRPQTSNDEPQARTPRKRPAKPKA